MRHYTLTTEDVGKAHLRAFGQVWPVSGFIGRILPRDVGKRVYVRGNTVGGQILQVENDEQRAARISSGPTSQFDDNVAWLQFMSDRYANCGPAGWESPRELRMMRIAFDWAMTYPKGQSAPPAKTDRLCQALHNHNPEDYDAKMAAPRCGCPTGCGMMAVLHLFRITAYVHESPIYVDVATVFCEPCGDDALESGLYCVGDDLLEPHHGPGCVKRMHADAEGGQS